MRALRVQEVPFVSVGDFETTSCPAPPLMALGDLSRRPGTLTRQLGFHKRPDANGSARRCFARAQSASGTPPLPRFALWLRRLQTGRTAAADSHRG